MSKPEKLVFTKSTACFSPCRTWRYTLERIWDNGPLVNFLCLNPSTADEVKSDPTVTRCLHYARRWGYGGCIVTNIFALRSTYPAVLLTHRDPVGPENDHFIREVAHRCALVVVAWGVWGKVNDRGPDIAGLLSADGITLYCLGVTKEGFPRHPLYMPASARPCLYATTHRPHRKMLAQLRQEERSAEIRALSNAELMEEVLRLAGGDDWDGGFTTFGAWEYDFAKTELRTRLDAWLKCRGPVR